MKNKLKLLAINIVFITIIAFCFNFYYKDESDIYKIECEKQQYNDYIRNIFVGKKIDTIIFQEYDISGKESKVNIKNGVIVFTPLDGCQSCVTHQLSLAKAIKDSSNLYVVFPNDQYKNLKDIQKDYDFEKIYIDPKIGIDAFKKYRIRNPNPIIISVRDGIIYSVSFNTLANSIYLSHAYGRFRIDTNYENFCDN